ncbi:hypothetical protein [Bacillus nitroreducens]
MKKSQSNENIILKQKIIHFQSELNKYKEKLKRYENHSDHSDYGQLNHEKQLLEIEVAELSDTVEGLKKEIEELKIENDYLRGINPNVAGVNEQSNEKKKTLDSWFVNNLEHQNAIKRSKRLDSNK